MNNKYKMKFLFTAVFVLSVFRAFAADPEIPAVTRVLQSAVDSREVSGAIAMVIAPEGIVHLSCAGLSDIAGKVPMSLDRIFWIASMTKPVTACAIMMLQDEGKLSVDDPVSKYIPELSDVKTADGKSRKLTLKHLLTHTSGLAEPTEQESLEARNLAELVPKFASRPLHFEPGTRWQYSQSGLNSLGRIIEVISGKNLQDFFHDRLFKPLGMNDTAFYPDSAQMARLAKSYKLVNGKLEETSVYRICDAARSGRYPAANGGLYSTVSDYGRFCRMLLNNGTFEGKRYLTPESVAGMGTIHSGELKTGFTDGNGWGLGCCVVRTPQGVTAMLSPGTFGHGGAYGTQAWIDPVKKTAYILMVQRANFPNSDNSDLRREFQAAAAAALGAGK